MTKTDKTSKRLTWGESDLVLVSKPKPAEKFNPYHGEHGRFTFAPGTGRNPNPHEAANAERDLLNGDIKVLKPVGQGQTEPKVAEINGKKVCYKPKPEIVPEMEAFWSPEAEYTAYQISKNTGMNVVPVTAMRGSGDSRSSVQHWMGGSYRDAKTIPYEEMEALQKTPQFRKLQILDEITGNQDRHAGNWLINTTNASSRDFHIAAIDHGFSFTELGAPVRPKLNLSEFPKNELEEARGHVSRFLRDVGGCRTLTVRLMGDRGKEAVSRAQELMGRIATELEGRY